MTSLSSKAVRVYREEGGLEVIRRSWLKLKAHWASLLAGKPSPSIPSSTHIGLIRDKPLESVDVIVCVHNALEDVQRCLYSLEQRGEQRMRLLLVDDGSQPETAEFLRHYATVRNLRLIRNETARGYTFAANQGLRASSADQVILLNTDTIVSHGWLDGLQAAANSDHRIGIVGPLSNTASWQSIPRVENAGDWMNNTIPEGLDIDAYADSLRMALPSTPAEVGFINGFCILIRRETLNDVGLFDEDIFGKGYGEENDFCLRAHKKGWKLVVSLHSYVFHAQSKSYSDERRKILSTNADRLLDAKHGDKLKHQQLSTTMEHPLLLFSRAASLNAQALHSSKQNIQQRHSGRRILFLLPAGNAGGGSNVVISEAMALRAAGVDAWIANIPANRSSFRASYPDLQIPCCYIALDDPSQLAFQAREFDVVVATHNLSAHWAATLDNASLGYYIQDFEPYFYPAKSKGWQTAFSSYTTKAPFKAFCKTDWTANILKLESNLDCTVIGPSIDAVRYAPSGYYPPSSSSQQPVNRPLHVVAMIRLSCERRQPRLTAEVLQSLKQRFGNQVNLFAFGSSDAELLAHGINPKSLFTNLGRLNPLVVAELLRQADIFIDASTFQAMGLTAMEAMASGSAVVGPREGGLTELVDATGKPLAYCVDTNSRQEILEACSALITDREFRETLAKRAYQVNRYHPLFAAEKMVDLLFSAA